MKNYLKPFTNFTSTTYDDFTVLFLTSCFKTFPLILYQL